MIYIIILALYYRFFDRNNACRRATVGVGTYIYM